MRPLLVDEREDTCAESDELNWDDYALVCRKSAKNGVQNSRIWSDEKGNSSLMAKLLYLKRSDRHESSVLPERSLKRNSITFAEELEVTISYDLPVEAERISQSSDQPISSSFERLGGTDNDLL